MNRIITIIIILIVVVPLFAALSAGEYYYNFGSMQVGTFPANNTNFSFSIVNPVSKTDIGIKDIDGSIGLNILSLNPYYAGQSENGTYLNVSFMRGTDEAIVLEFNYSENNVGGAEINDFILNSNGSEIAFSFSNSQNLQIDSPSDMRTGTTVSVNIWYTMKIAFFHGRTLVFLNTTDGSFNMPLVFNASIPPGQTDLLIGSTAVNLTLYNISVVRYPAMMTQDGSLYRTYDTDIPYVNDTVYYLDYPENAVIGIDDSGVRVSNYVNDTSYPIVNFNSSYYTYSAYDGIIYVLSVFRNETKLFSIDASNFTDISIQAIRQNLTGYLAYSNGKMLILHRNSSTYLYFLASGDLDHMTCGTFEYYDREIRSLIFYNDTERDQIIYSIDNDSTVMRGFSNTTYPYLDVSDGISFIAYGDHSNVGIYGDHLIYGIYNVSNYLYYGDHEVIIGNTSLNLTYHIDYASAFNSSAIVIGSSGRLFLLYRNVVMPVNGSMSVLFHRIPYMHLNSWLNFTVYSAYPYSAVLKIGNVTDRAYDESDFLVDSRLLDNGTNDICLGLNNSVGFKYGYRTTVFVDNYEPSITASVPNGSYAAYGTNVSLYIKNDPLISSIFINSHGYESSYTGNAWFVLNYTGIDVINITIMDRFGLEFNFSLNYDVYADQNFSVNIYNGEYFNTSLIPISIKPDCRTFTVFGSNNTVSGNGTVIFQAKEGENNLTVYLTYFGRNVTVFSGHIYVITFHPLLIINYTHNRFYSFYGNSRNNTMMINVSSNITADLFVYIIHEGIDVAVLSFLDTAHLMFNASSPYFVLGGNYSIEVEAISRSGTKAAETISIYENSTVPPSYNYDIYTNTTEVRIPFHGNRIVTSANLSGDHILLPGYGTYTFTFYNYTLTGNYGTITLVVHASLYRPVIYARFANITIDGIAYLIINVQPSNLTGVHIKVGNQSCAITNGSAIYRIPFDGIFIVKVSGSDAYGNSNNMIYKIPEYPYMEIRSIVLQHDISLIRSSMRLRISGYDISNLNITWYVNGVMYAGGYSRNISNRIGLNTVMVSVSGRNVSKVLHYNFYSPSYAVFSISGSAIAYPLYLITRNKDLDSLKKMMENSDGKSVSDLRKLARKRRYSNKQFREVLEKERIDGSLRVEQDPDGEEFVIGRKGSGG
ncbi:hypothetical protein DMB44_06575 [Thermoplasma sp. Kam2015]|uniref:hypothetical protein n=1 Tax=Thermoplasma sp. Kam2015 TaxID=2094122 RepID=UPI000D822E28|nr:hypothetical protein [Thermoplasma sp. Kam2015]PYB67950.1 hypothetical protein DMB44_06575 [Thermoplasma sp. Kam2015]